jgi:hypothetical protein
MNTRPKLLEDADEIIRITNHFARCGIFIDTSKRTDDWIAFIKDNHKKWEAGKTELEALQKMEITLSLDT